MTPSTSSTGRPAAPGWRALLANAVPAVIGPLLVVFAVQHRLSLAYAAGVALTIVGAALLARWVLLRLGLRGPERVVFTLAGLAMFGFTLTLPGLAGFGPKKAADLVRKYGSVRAMIDAGIFRDADAEYLEKAMRVVAPVADLKIKVPPGRRNSYPEDPARTEELGKRYGVNSSIERLVKALTSMPA